MTHKLTNQELLERLRGMRDVESFFRMSFFPLPKKRSEMLDIEAHIRKSFRLWWDTYMKPLIDEVERKITRNSYRRHQKKLFSKEGEKVSKRKKKR